MDDLVEAHQILDYKEALERDEMKKIDQPARR